jgi:hypothetical protein
MSRALVLGLPQSSFIDRGIILRGLVIRKIFGSTFTFLYAYKKGRNPQGLPAI